ncbi:hypothetical protein BDN72DRAFT_893667 [Pluteus cervinus]|uniref:Uncharacterized protein n=1 Tax=Pluteus cervinus TaxID=181527 RepID=A0ACD3B5X1_9AGAR|nr:hypothetical protein BDN72DRAFT_893667 [Pluteus cervinus]
MSLSPSSDRHEVALDTSTSPAIAQSLSSVIDDKEDQLNNNGTTIVHFHNLTTGSLTVNTIGVNKSNQATEENNNSLAETTNLGPGAQKNNNSSQSSNLNSPTPLTTDGTQMGPPVIPVNFGSVLPFAELSMLPQPPNRQTNATFVAVSPVPAMQQGQSAAAPYPRTSNLGSTDKGLVVAPTKVRPSRSRDEVPVRKKGPEPAPSELQLVYEICLRAIDADDTATRWGIGSLVTIAALAALMKGILIHQH